MYFIKSQKGFSLIEMLVVIAMIGILSVLVFADFRGQGQNTLFKYTSEDVLGAAIQVREFSKSGKILSTINQVPLGGYGIFFDIGSGVISQFADTNNNDIFDEKSKNEFIAKVSYNSNFMISEFYLGKNTLVPVDSELDKEYFDDKSGKSQPSKSKFYVIFENPNGDMLIVDEKGQSDYASASLGLLNKTTGQKLYLNFSKQSGAISIDENVIKK